MTAPASETAAPPAALPALVDLRLARATAALCRDHPVLAPAVRGVLAPLRDRLYRLHVASRQAAAAAWAGYTADLDRGLDELSAEVARAAEQPGRGRGVDDVLSAAAARLELNGWELRLDALALEGRDVSGARQLADALAGRIRELTGSPGSAELRSQVVRELAGLRTAVPAAERN